MEPLQPVLKVCTTLAVFECRFDLVFLMRKRRSNDGGEGRRGEGRGEGKGEKSVMKSNRNCYYIYLTLVPAGRLVS